MKFHRVIWLKGFTCPNDILESIKVSEMNEAAMVCGMDWAEHNGFFIFSDRWRTRDIDGDQFRLSRSSSAPSAGPPRDKVGSQRYAAHLPFQVFCCESGTHIVDPSQSYYRGIAYRAADNYHNLTTSEPVPEWDPEGACMDSTQAWFCRDLWIDAAKDGGMRSGRTSNKEAQMGPWGAAEEEQEDRRGANEKKVETTTTTTTSSEEPSPTQDEAFKPEQSAQNDLVHAVAKKTRPSTLRVLFPHSALPAAMKPSFPLNNVQRPTPESPQSLRTLPTAFNPAAANAQFEYPVVTTPSYDSDNVELGLQQFRFRHRSVSGTRSEQAKQARPEANERRR
ncbi:Cryptococcal mannosyltransferase 1 [Tulasnella sp. 408]|nr:Cryptococcal mannosyltransferase 1 [Tulasnella sp. 408]